MRRANTEWQWKEEEVNLIRQVIERNKINGMNITLNGKWDNYEIRPIRFKG